VYEHSQDNRDEGERRRREIESRLLRIAELYKWGDMTREAYQSERDALQCELASLKRSGDLSDLLRRMAVLLRDFPTLWAAATPDQRNALARVIFESIEITDDRVTAVTVHPDFAAYFAAFGQQNTPAS
jgi:hypothetical protein